MKDQKDNTTEYAKKVISQLMQIFDEDCENHISVDELSDGVNLRDFLHAVANMAPTMIYREFTKDDVNNLEFNHIANKLVFQYSNQHK